MKPEGDLRTARKAGRPGDPPCPLPTIAVVIPSFRAAATIGAVLGAIGPEVRHIYVVDDGCPDSTGERALRDHDDPRLTVLRNARNLGVGGAMKNGFAGRWPTARTSSSSSTRTARWTRATLAG